MAVITTFDSAQRGRNRFGAAVASSRGMLDAFVSKPSREAATAAGSQQVPGVECNCFDAEPPSTTATPSVEFGPSPPETAYFSRFGFG